MKTQVHRVKFGKEEKAVLTVNNPVLKFWKKANVEWDLSKCSEKNQSKALSRFAKILEKKMEKRHFTIPIKLSIISTEQ